MRLLILGGTVFLGRALAVHARAAGHDVTCAARGVSGAPPDGVRFITIDRDRADGFAPLDGERHIWWNFVSSSRARIEQAKRDWKERRFPPVPGETEFIPLPDS